MTRTAPLRSVRVKAYAKLNLGLRVLYKRPDQYHELRTVFQTISLADDLTIEYQPAPKTRIEVLGCPEIPDNLVVRAAAAVLEELQLHGDIRFTLRKRIPAGAGLGGGSSDAASVLLALPVLAQKPLLPQRLFAIAARLGSDVPFFLHGGTALGLGRGEELYPLPDRAPSRGLLIAPGIHSSTAEAYRDVSQTLTTIPLQNKLFSFQQEVWEAGTETGNDFEPVVFARHPELAEIKQKLIRLGASEAAMTGSGSAIYGLFLESGKLHQAARSFPGLKVFPISLMSRNRYRSAWARALKLPVKGDPWPPRSPHEQ